jgi:hypothetical protein
VLDSAQTQESEVLGSCLGLVAPKPLTLLLLWYSGHRGPVGTGGEAHEPQSTRMDSLILPFVPDGHLCAMIFPLFSDCKDP